MKAITKKQLEVFYFVSKYILENNISPTIDEIRTGLGLKAVSTAHEHIMVLIKKGYLIKNSEPVRNLIPIAKVRKVIDIPVVGTISAGMPIEAIEQHDQFVSVINEKILHSKDFYALRVSGESMVDDGIYDGDIVVIKKQSTAENGQTVVAIIDENKATLKRIYREQNRFRLEPRNQQLLPFYRDEVEIRGVVFQVIRNISTEKVTESLEKRKIQLRTIDLFAGVGGIRLGFELAGFSTVFANDFEPKCKETYDLNFSDSKLVVEDIRKLGIEDLPEFDFLLGGFPCQAFSIAGYRKGFNDEKGRGNLFFDIARIIEARKPEGFLLENVKNLRSHDNGNTFKVIEETLIELGYHLKVKVLNSMEYGNIPQNRERIYIVGFKEKSFSDKFNFPDPIQRTVEIKDILDEDVAEKYYYNGRPLYEKLKPFVTDPNKVYQWRRQYVRENKKGVCPTLTANMGMGGHNVPIILDKKGIRKLTPKECARIQGFPDDYVLPAIADSALYKQFGNSVSVPVIERIAREIRKAVEVSI